LISEIEKTVAFRYLKPKRKEGFLKTISIFSFLGIAIGVAVLIIVMSVMNGFRTELIDKILGFNAHIIIKPYEKKIDFIINIPSTLTLEKYVGMLYDEYQIRRKSLELGIPVLSTIELAESFVKTLEWLQKNEPSTKPLESYKDIS